MALLQRYICNDCMSFRLGDCFLLLQHLLKTSMHKQAVILVIAIILMRTTISRCHEFLDLQGLS
jgi:hypothetical protein